MNSAISRLPAFADDDLTVNAIVETPKGGNNKFNYNPETGLFELGSALPEGFTFPFEFGFIPSTLGDDGDPLDLLILMDAPTFVGCHLRVRIIGVIEAEQTEKDGTAERNDRLLAVSVKSRRHETIHSVSDLPKELIKEI